MNRRQLTGLAALVVLALANPLAALAQSDYPNKPVKVMVGYGPGGGYDIYGRLVAESAASD